MGTRRVVGHSLQDGVNGVSIKYLEMKMLWEPDLIG